MVVIAIFRWLARLLATGAAGLLIAFFVDEGIGDPRALTDAELAGLGATLVMMAGALLGWRWDLLGGSLLLAGYGSFALLTPGWPPPALAPFAIAGVLLLVSGVVRRLRRRPPAASDATGDPLAAGS